MVVRSLAVVANLVLVLTPFLVKGGPDESQWVWLSAATFATGGAVLRLILMLRSGRHAREWADALRPTRLGAAIVVGVVVLSLTIGFFVGGR